MTGRAIAIAIAVLCLGVVALSVFVGPSLDGVRGEFIFWQLRVPRTLVGLLVGATLGLVGAAFQALFNNGLATPSTVGTTAGASLGALASLVFGAFPEVEGLPIVTLTAFAGAFSASLIVSAVASSGRAKMGDVLLAGIAVTLAASALSTAIQYMADMRALFAATQWSLGQLPQVGYDGVLVMTPFVGATIAIVLGLRRGLQALALGEELAHSQGVSVRRTRILVLGAGSLGVAACVAWCGPIAFVGLIVPHLVRRTVGSSLRALLPMSLLFGAGFLVACDTLGRVLIPGRELPVGVLTAAIGAPALMWLIHRGTR